MAWRPHSKNNDSNSPFRVFLKNASVNYLCGPHNISIREMLAPLPLNSIGWPPKIHFQIFSAVPGFSVTLVDEAEAFYSAESLIRQPFRKPIKSTLMKIAFRMIRNWDNGLNWLLMGKDLTVTSLIPSG